MKLNGHAPQTNNYTHSVTNLAAETARYRNASDEAKISKLRLKISDFDRLSVEVFALENPGTFANYVRFTGYHQ
jgi:hypothetical protein